MRRLLAGSSRHCCSTTRCCTFQDVKWPTRGSSLAACSASSEIHELLNEVLTAELTSVNQYFVDSKMLDNWGYDVLAQHYREESIDEMKDADSLIGRILFLEGVPNLQRLGTVRVGETVPEKLQLALDLEYESIERLNLGIDRVLRAGRRRHAGAARAHPRGRGSARRLARDPARADRAAGRDPLPRGAAPRADVRR